MRHLLKIIPLCVLFLLVGRPASAAISVTGKTCTNNSNSSSPVTCTWSTNPAIGETIHCWIVNYATGAFSGTDNGSTPNTYTANGSQYNGTALSGFYQFFDAVLRESRVH